MIEKMTSNPLSLATTAMDGGSAGSAGATNRSTPVLGQPPSRLTGLRLTISLLAGLFFTLGFAPFGFKPLTPLALALLLGCLQGVKPKIAAKYGLLFGLAAFGLGISWVYVSLHRFGGMAPPLAAVAVVLLVLYCALYPALVAWVYGHIQIISSTTEKNPYRRWLGDALLFSALWVLAEWLRSTLFSGFPWLLAGYSQIGWPLAGFAPILGIYGISLVTALTGSVLFFLWQLRGRSIPALLGLVLLWAGGYFASGIAWTKAAGPALKVAAVQGNIALADKWVAANRGRIRATYLTRSLPLRDRDLIVWPEAALPEAYDQLPPSLLRTLRQHTADFVIGVVEVNPKDRRQYFNSALVLSNKTQLYRKHHLVPFGEFLPLPGLLGWLIDYLKIPMSHFSAGTSGQTALELAGTKAAIDICYEDAFADEIAAGAVGSRLLINLSEDAWFGNSLAPHQRLEMARMRSLETGRPMLRAANTGPSAIINADGRVLAVSPQFITTVLSGKIQPRSGSTPFMRTGSTPLLLILLILSILIAARKLLPRVCPETGNRLRKSEITSTKPEIDRPNSVH